MISIENPSLVFLDDATEFGVAMTKVNQVCSPRMARIITDARLVLR
jgi:hypothetical protein